MHSEADYVLNLKGNHRHLHGGVAAWFEACHASEQIGPAHSHYRECASTNNHGRIESREHWLMAVPEHLKRATKYWTNLQTIAMVRRTRQVAGKTSDETHYYISSLPLSASAQTIAQAIRSHWAVENELHWSLDVSFREGRLQSAQGRRPGQPGVPAPPGAHPASARDQPEGQRQKQALPRWLGSGLYAQGA